MNKKIVLLKVCVMNLLFCINSMEKNPEINKKSVNYLKINDCSDDITFTPKKKLNNKNNSNDAHRALALILLTRNNKEMNGVDLKLWLKDYYNKRKKKKSDNIAQN